MIGVFEFIELYLIRDLESMRSLKSEDGLGKCGYQMITSLCSACEILGSLERNEFSRSGGNERFKFFLEKHLVEYVPSWEILYYFIRHRVAHDFITPPGIAIRLNNDKIRHLGMIDEWFVVDAYVFMDDFISAYKQIKVRYEKDIIYKKLLDNGYQLLIQFVKERSNELDTKLSQAKLKSLPYPDEYLANDKDVAVPSGAMFEFDQSNITRIPDDMLEKMNISIQTTVASGASGSRVDGEDIKPLVKESIR